MLHEEAKSQQEQENEDEQQVEDAQREEEEKEENEEDEGEEEEQDEAMDKEKKLDKKAPEEKQQEGTEFDPKTSMQTQGTVGDETLNTAVPFEGDLVIIAQLRDHTADIPNVSKSDYKQMSRKERDSYEKKLHEAFQKIDAVKEFATKHGKNFCKSVPTIKKESEDAFTTLDHRINDIEEVQRDESESEKSRSRARWTPWQSTSADEVRRGDQRNYRSES